MNRLEERVADQPSALAGFKTALDVFRMKRAEGVVYDDAVAAAISALEAQGLKIVPVEPTEEMLEAGEGPIDLLAGSGIETHADVVWAAMLNAVEG